jgi:hypothetical protein
MIATVGAIALGGALVFVAGVLIRLAFAKRP